MVVGGANLIAGAAEIVVEFPLDIGPDLRLGAASSGKEDGSGGGFCTLDALRVVVGDFGSGPGHLQGALQAVIQPADCRDSHGRAVAPATVWPGIFLRQPIAEPSTIAGIWILLAPLLHGVDHCAAYGIQIRGPL